MVVLDGQRNLYNYQRGPASLDVMLLIDESPFALLFGERTGQNKSAASSGGMPG
ncbi:hypothetical protein MCB86_22095 [Pseudomonas sp. KSR10]|jgi:hypothetical protein|uniref:hypothetical protein n=1 Tax=unclassified Pseudomonas TaxID=196821 RepID=UPI001EF96BA6|nr:hypothetical protein [Pseudomonas sp. KSR10]MCG6542771.1 hypothetical protein [Pseudomonas sp. KSR10]